MRTSVAVSIGDDPEKRQLDQQCKLEEDMYEDISRSKYWR